MFKYFINPKNLFNIKYIHKIIYILSNFIYFLPVIIYKFNKITICAFLIGIISTLFHIFQFITLNLITKILMYLDYSVTLGVFIYVIFTLCKILPIWCYAILVLTFIFFCCSLYNQTNIQYIYMHLLWHIVTGLLLLYASYKYNNYLIKKNKNTK